MILGFVLIAILIIVFAVLTCLTPADRKLLFSKPKTLLHDNLERKYRIHVPNTLANKNSKLVLAFHGYKSNGWQMAYLSGFHNSTDDKTIVVYPNASNPIKSGQRRGWNAGFCCGCGWTNNVDDIGFTLKLVETVKKQYGVSPKQIYAVGFSNGAMFVQRLATEHPLKFAAFASVSGSIGTEKSSLEPHEPVPILLVHGEKDMLVPFSGGQGSTDSSFDWRSFQQTKRTWEINNKQAKPISSVTYQNLGHAWPGWRITKFWRQKTIGSELIVKFFNTIK